MAKGARKYGVIGEGFAGVARPVRIRCDARPHAQARGLAARLRVSRGCARAGDIDIAAKIR